MEGLAGATSVIAVIQLADRILTLSGKYALSVKDAKEDIDRFTTEVGSLQSVLKGVAKMAEGDAMKLCTSHSAVEGLEGIIKRCQSTLLELESQLDPRKGHKLMSHFGLRALKWPFKSKKVINIIEALDRHKSTIVLALNLDQR
jgi:Fungal N-terminal domain of STAND proteins